MTCLPPCDLLPLWVASDPIHSVIHLPLVCVCVCLCRRERASVLLPCILELFFNLCSSTGIHCLCIHTFREVKRYQRPFIQRSQQPWVLLVLPHFYQETNSQCVCLCVYVFLCMWVLNSKESNNLSVTLRSRLAEDPFSSAAASTWRHVFLK